MGKLFKYGQLRFNHNALKRHQVILIVNSLSINDVCTCSLQMQCSVREG